MTLSTFLCVAVLLLCLQSIHSFQKKTTIRIKTRKLSSIKNLPYDFYSLKYCKPRKIQNDVESISEALFGDRIKNSIFNFEFRTTEEIKCQKIETSSSDIHGRPTGDPALQIQCPGDYSKNDINDFISKIKDDYEVQFLVDNLPIANKQLQRDCGNMPSSSSTVQQKVYRRPDGFPVGCISRDGSKYYLNNHWSFIIKYHRDISKKKIYIVGAEAIPSSIDYTKTDYVCLPEEPLPESIPDSQKLILEPDTPLDSITWTYSLRWEQSPIKWASRWDAYANIADSDSPTIHWFAIINSVMIVLLLTAMVAMIMLRVLGRDIKHYDENEDDESGWKLIHGDVFRPPFGAALLSVIYGNGIQLVAMCFVTLMFAVLGLSDPRNRGNLVTVMLILFALMGALGGYNALRCYKMLSGTAWKTVTVLTALLFPALIIGIYTFMNLFVRVVDHSSSAVPFLTLLKVFFLWSGVSVPLGFIGGYFGYKQEKIKQPTEVNSIPRYIPDQPWYLTTPIVILSGGILPFGAAFIEIYFIMTSIWLHRFYYVFGFLLLVFFILLLTCCEITIVLVYFQLCHENHKWWWRSFLMSGSSALYLFVYSVFYFFTKIQSKTLLLAIVYFEYMSIISWLFFLMTGSVGFVSSLWFLRKIYSQIKVM